MNISIEEIKEAAERGHSIGSLILMLEKKNTMLLERRHWFIMKDGRNVCEFCGRLYSFRDSSNCNQHLLAIRRINHPLGLTVNVPDAAS